MSPSRFRRRALVAAVLAAATARAQVPAPIDRGALEPGIPREEQVAAGEAHTWSVPTAAAQVYEVRVEQLGGNVEVRWTAGGETRRVNKREGWSGEEVVWWVAADAAPATVTVRLAKQLPARYRIVLLPPRAAEASDRERHEAEKAMFAPPDLDALESSARRFAALHLPDRQVLALARLGTLADDRGDLPRARRAGEECVAVARGSALEEDLAKCLVGLANVLRREAGQDAAAEAAYTESLRIREARGDPGPISAVLHDWANLLVDRGEYDRADAQIRRSIALAESDADDIGAAVGQASLGILASYRGDPEAAVTAFENAFAAVRARGRPDQKAMLALNVGIAYGVLGDAERSIARLREAVALAEASGLKPMVALGRLGIASELDDLGDLEAAATETRAALALAREVTDVDVEANGEGQLGWLLARLGRRAEAVEHAAAAVAVAARAEKPKEIANAALFQGMVLTSVGRLDDAEAPLRRALEWYTATARVDDQARARLALARLMHARGNREAALEEVERALAGFESVRTQMALADRRAHYFAFRREAYDVALGVLLDGDHKAQAFEMTERARARSFLEELGRRGDLDARAESDPLARGHRAALDRLAYLQRELVARYTAAAPDRAALALLEKELEEAVALEERARRALREKGAGPRPPGPARVRAADVAARLGPDEALLEYHVGADRSWLFALGPGGLDVFALPSERVLRQHVDALRALLARPAVLGAGPYATAAHDLYTLLVGPAQPALARARRVRVVPDGPLWEVPFEALVTRSGAGGRYAGLAYALRRWDFVYHPSSSVIVLGDEAGPQAAPPAELVAFANPRFTEAPSTAARARLERAVFREGDRWSLPPLPCAEREARQVGSMFGKRSTVLIGPAALESRVKSDPAVARARYLLFSTHALLSETMPSQSSLVLTLQGDGAEDGLLQTHEIEALRLEADLVLLSACDSALGRNLRGEGLLGLARGFFHAGARALVASLWKVSDCSTADLTTAFFSGLLKRSPGDAAAALRGAKLGLLAKAATAHPYYWAPFVLIDASGGGRTRVTITRP